MSMDYVHVADSFRETLKQIRKAAIGVFPADVNQHSVLSLIRIPHEDSSTVRDYTPVEMAEFYYSQLEDLRAYCAFCEPSQLADWVLQLTDKVENWKERGIIGDMPPLHAPSKPEENLVVDPAKTSGNELRAWRIECFRDLQFTEREAEKLADAITVDIVKDKAGVPRRYESPLHHGKAKKMLDAGVNHKQIVNLLT
jgi:hypothetical protein